MRAISVKYGASSSACSRFGLARIGISTKRLCVAPIPPCRERILDSLKSSNRRSVHWNTKQMVRARVADGKQSAPVTQACFDRDQTASKKDGPFASARPQAVSTITAVGNVRRRAVVSPSILPHHRSLQGRRYGDDGLGAARCNSTVEEARQKSAAQSTRRSSEPTSGGSRRPDHPVPVASDCWRRRRLASRSSRLWCRT